jgi:hypothetical protein
MAYSRNALQRVGPQNSAAPTIYTYRDAASTVAQIDDSGYFNDAADILKVDDLIYAVGSNGYGLAVVNSNSGGVVDVTNLTAVGTIDSN